MKLKTKLAGTLMLIGLLAITSCTKEATPVPTPAAAPGVSYTGYRETIPGQLIFDASPELYSMIVHNDSRAPIDVKRHPGRLFLQDDIWHCWTEYPKETCYFEVISSAQIPVNPGDIESGVSSGAIQAEDCDADCLNESNNIGGYKWFIAGVPHPVAQPISSIRAWYDENGDLCGTIVPR